MRGLVITALWCLGVALTGLWLWVWWAAATSPQPWVVVLNFNYFGEGVWEGVLLHGVLVFLLGVGVWGLRVVIPR